MSVSVSKATLFKFACNIVSGAAASLVLSQASFANPALVVDARSGQVIYADEATRPWHPASTTKLMTVYIALKMLKAGQITLETPLQGTKRAAAQKPSKIGIRPGQIITLDNALKILLVKSANDIAYVIAENLAGSSEAFVARMNNEAQRLGMRESYFTNPNGWHDSRQQTSARDMALLARALLIEFPDYHDYWGIGSVRLGGRVYKNTNGLIGRYDGALGMKTGFVCASGFNVVALADRGGRSLITVIMGASSSSERTIQAAQLFDRGFQGGSTGQSLADLPGSGQQSAQSVRAQVCNGRRGVPLTDEDYDGAIVSSPGQDAGSDKDSIYATMRADHIGGSAALRRAGGSRYALGERNLGEPVAVYLGRAPGNADPVFRQSGGTALARSTASPVVVPGTPVLASVGRAKASSQGLRPVPQAPVPQIIEADTETDEVSTPLALADPGVAAPRPSAKAGIRSNPSSSQPRKLGAISTTSGGSGAKPKPGAPAGKSVATVAPSAKSGGLVRPAPVLPKAEAKKRAQQTSVQTSAAAASTKASNRTGSPKLRTNPGNGDE